MIKVKIKPFISKTTSSSLIETDMTDKKKQIKNTKEETYNNHT